jgi:benzoyl-CoA reductase/2-hydroxyglutaryl-CoA dehydratase subunit BcrC/BadD/HgdB
MHPLSSEAEELYFEELSHLDSLRKTGLCTGAVVCRAFPPAVLAGLGVRPVRIPVDVSGEKRDTAGNLVRQDVCPLVRELLRDIQSDCSDFIVGMHTCDMTRRLFQESDRFSTTPVHQIQLPATKGDASLRFFTSQVHRICRDLKGNGFSSGYDSSAAEDWYCSTMEAASFLRSKADTIPPVALQYLLHLFRIADPATLKKKIETLLDSAELYEPEFTLLLTGSPAVPGDNTVAETVEAMGGALIPVNCTGFQMFPDKLEKPDDFSVATLCRIYFESMKCVRCRPNSETFSSTAEELRSAGAHGLIVKTLKFCDLWFTEKARMKEAFQLPVLVLDTAFSSGEIERTAVRVESFVQSLGGI